MYILLDTAKQHLNVDKDFHEDDGYILHLIQTAEAAIEKRIDRKLEDCVDDKTGYLPQTIIHSILLLIGSWYSSRETFTYTSVNEMPHSFEFLANLEKHYYIP